MQVTKLNPEAKAEWVAALRSGEFLQGRNALEVVDGSGASRFCCLGVACFLAEEKGLIQRELAEGDSLYNYGAEGRGWWNGALPPRVSEWLVDIHDTTADKSNVWVDYGGAGHSLSFLNDQYEVGFDKIADLIEAQC